MVSTKRLKKDISILEKNYEKRKGYSFSEGERRLKEEIHEHNQELKHLNTAIDALDALDDDRATGLYHEKKQKIKELEKLKRNLINLHNKKIRKVS